MLTVDVMTFVGEMDSDEPLEETNNAAHVRIGNTLPARCARHSLTFCS